MVITLQYRTLICSFTQSIYSMKTLWDLVSKDLDLRDFPGGTVVKNPPANAGDTSLSPGPGRFHMPWRN